MKHLDRWWVLTGLIFLLIGMGLGLKMSLQQNFLLHGLHAHLNLLGFVLMTLFGLCYRHWPRMQESVLARVHYWLHTVTVAIALGLLYFLLTDAELAPKVAPAMHTVLVGAYAGIFLFTYLFYTRARD
jgi:hypothetical protein